jgi:hypothetical protein
MHVSEPGISADVDEIIIAFGYSRADCEKRECQGNEKDE